MYWNASSRGKPRPTSYACCCHGTGPRPTPASSLRWLRSRGIRNGSGNQFKSTHVLAATLTLQQLGIGLIDFDDAGEGFDAEVGEPHDAVVARTVDPDQAILSVHFIGH